MFDHLWKFEKSDAINYRSLKNPQSDTAIIFIHGLGGSNNYWSKDYNYLGHNSSLYYIDLIGFGYSAKPNIEYTMEAHIAALRQFIKTQVGEQNIILVGQSAGAIVALNYYRQYPEQIRHIYLLSLSYFPNKIAAERAIHNSHHALSAFLSDTFLAHVACHLMCLFRPFFLAFAPDFLTGYPQIVAHDAFLHTHASYFGTLKNVVINQNIPQLLRRRNENRITLVHGHYDTLTPLEDIAHLSNDFRIPLITLKTSGHDFPLFQQQKVIQILSSPQV
jgi:pimeloyl-ACP methyl ester carboxylesterase